MKKMILLLLAVVVLLTGCSFLKKETDDTRDPVESVERTEPASEETEPPRPWLEEVKIPWDQEGALYEIPLTLPDALHYSSVMEFNGDLLLWSADHHLENKVILELCLFDLDKGRVIATRDCEMTEVTAPQAVGDRLYLCDSAAGHIEAWDANLMTVETWDTEPHEGNWYMGSGGKLYMHNWDNSVWVRDLATGETAPLMEEDPGISYMISYGESALINYYRTDTGAPACAVLDFTTGEVYDPPIPGDYLSASYADGNWLCGTYADHHNYIYCTEGGEPVAISPDGLLQLLDGKYIINTSEEDTVLRLYDLEGKCLTECTLSANIYSYSVLDFIWNEEFGGFFCTVNCYDGSHRLLFWDISQGRVGEDLNFQYIPEPSEEDALLKQRAEELGEKYGLTILVGDDCDTVFDEFYAEIETDYWTVNNALDTLDAALSVYPEGFFRQLRYGSVYGIRIQLITNLMADGSGRYGDGYSAFAQEKWDHYLVVMDIEDTYTETYYHEISHIIDSYLEWDSWNREDALYSEEAWAAMNPDWFTGYSYDYSVEHYLEDYESFVDSYSTISPTEDRARVMEYAMMDYGVWTFEDADILVAKLAYYSRCIRDAFDTEGWPEMLPWEQYLR